MRKTQLRLAQGCLSTFIYESKTRFLVFWSFPYMLLSLSSLVDKICSHRNLSWQNFSNLYLRKEKMLRRT